MARPQRTRPRLQFRFSLDPLDPIEGVAISKINALADEARTLLGECTEEEAQRYAIKRLMLQLISDLPGLTTPTVQVQSPTKALTTEKEIASPVKLVALGSEVTHLEPAVQTDFEQRGEPVREAAQQKQVVPAPQGVIHVDLEELPAQEITSKQAAPVSLSSEVSESASPQSPSKSWHESILEQPVVPRTSPLVSLGWPGAGE
ncbi:hypothetical protein ACI2KR_30700 [Pseudomonas luteola]